MPRFPETDTSIDPEERAYNTPTGTHWGSQRKARAIFPDGKIRTVTVGVPDTAWTVPGHDSRGNVGYVDVEYRPEGAAYVWHPRARA